MFAVSGPEDTSVPAGHRHANIVQYAGFSEPKPLYVHSCPLFWDHRLLVSFVHVLSSVRVQFEAVRQHSSCQILKQTRYQTLSSCALNSA